MYVYKKRVKQYGTNDTDDGNHRSDDRCNTATDVFTLDVAFSTKDLPLMGKHKISRTTSKGLFWESTEGVLLFIAFLRSMVMK